MDKIKEFIVKLNHYGVPIPLIRLNDKPTFTGTMTLLAFLTALVGQLGKVSHLLGDIDLTQANYLFMISLGAYLGRKMQKDEKGISISNEPAPIEETIQQ